eukprot:scaffold136550_cov127-Phaeocystis_antarctica.AAC.1
MNWKHQQQHTYYDHGHVYKLGCWALLRERGGVSASPKRACAETREGPFGRRYRSLLQCVFGETARGGGELQITTN